MYVVNSIMPDRFAWKSPDGKFAGVFRASPKQFIRFAYKEGESRYAKSEDISKYYNINLFSAVIYAGFNIEPKAELKLKAMVYSVKLARWLQVKHNDLSIMYRRGSYTIEKDGDTKICDAVQIGLLNTYPTIRRPITFRKQIVRIAEQLCRDFGQEIVIVRIEKNLEHQETIGATP